MEDRFMYVRYLGSKACWTIPGGRFYIGDREELSDDEGSVCENGGGYLPLSAVIDVVAS